MRLLSFLFGMLGLLFSQVATQGSALAAANAYFALTTTVWVFTECFSPGRLSENVTDTSPALIGESSNRTGFSVPGLMVEAGFDVRPSCLVTRKLELSACASHT